MGLKVVMHDARTRDTVFREDTEKERRPLPRSIISAGSAASSFRICPPPHSRT